MILAVSISAAVLLVGCSSDDSSNTVAEVAQVDTNEIVIDDFRFTPATTTVKVGVAVTWTNQQGVAHTTTASDGTWDSGSIGTDASFSNTFDEAGEFSYFCAIHPSMTGTITVEG
ncbi:MAG: hypothetical protein DWP92_02980 [Armatimonadetes bacterium]|nr:MAG: hypothetical protein DWP92_02980 [Armatimonadota bacterium]